MSSRDKLSAVSDLVRSGLAPRGLSRVQAAAYIGVSVGLFDAMVADRRMPPPKLVNDRKIWDIRALDLAFERLPDNESKGANDDVGDDVWSRARA